MEMRMNKTMKAISAAVMIAVIILTGMLAQMTVFAVSGGKVIEKDHATHSRTILFKKDLGKIDIGNCARVQIGRNLKGRYLITHNDFIGSYLISRKVGFSKKNWFNSAAVYIKPFDSRVCAVNSFHAYNGTQLIRITKNGEARYLVIGKLGSRSDVQQMKTTGFYKFWKTANQPDSIKVSGLDGWHVRIIARGR